MGKLTLRFLFAVAVLGNTCRLFKYLTAIRTFQRQNFVNSALTDIGITLSAQTGVHKHLVNVTQTSRLTVDVILAVTAAIVPPGDHHLIRLIRQGAVGIVQGQGSFCKAHRRTLLSAAKNHVLHFCATESLGALLTHNPQNRIGNIRFAGTVGAHDGGDIIAKPDQRLIREGLKALYFQTF